MSRVYKQSQLVIGEEKVVKLELKQIIKFDENKALDKSGDNQIEVQKITKSAETILAEAQIQANKLLEDAQLEFNKIIGDAEEEREAIISDTYTKSNEILESAREEGYKDGLIQGREAGLNEVDSIIKEAKEIKEDTILEKKSMARSLESQIIELVVSCVKKVIDYEVEKDHQLLLNLVKKGIEKCIYTDSLVIRVSTNDYEIVNSSKDKIYIMTEGIDSIEVKKDPALKDSSIIIETTSGTVEASIQTQIAQIEQMFHDIFKGE